MKYFLCLILMITSLSWGGNSVVVSGKLILMIEDDFDRGISREIYQLEEDKTSKIYHLKFPKDKVPEGIKNSNPGSKIKIRGKKSDGIFLFESIEKGK